MGLYPSPFNLFLSVTSIDTQNKVKWTERNQASECKNRRYNYQYNP